MKQLNHQRTLFGTQRTKKTFVQLKLLVVVLKIVKLISLVREQVINALILVRVLN